MIPLPCLPFASSPPPPACLLFLFHPFNFPPSHASSPFSPSACLRFPGLRRRFVLGAGCASSFVSVQHLLPLCLGCACNRCARTRCAAARPHACLGRGCFVRQTSRRQRAALHCAALHRTHSLHTPPTSPPSQPPPPPPPRPPNAAAAARLAAATGVICNTKNRSKTAYVRHFLSSFAPAAAHDFPRRSTTAAANTKAQQHSERASHLAHQKLPSGQ